MVIIDRGKIKRSVSTHFSDLPNGFKRVFNFTLIDLNTSFLFTSKLQMQKPPKVNLMILILYENGLGQVYTTTWFGNTVTVENE